jgi:hypothetical protein
MRVGVFVVTAVLVAQALRRVLFRQTAPLRIHPNGHGVSFGPHDLACVLFWGIPFGLIFSGFMVLQAANKLGAAAAIGLSMAGGALGGVGFGALMFVIGRLWDPGRMRRG